jgi:hypothetical protein
MVPPIYWRKIDWINEFGIQSAVIRAQPYYGGGIFHIGASPTLTWVRKTAHFLRDNRNGRK